MMKSKPTKIIVCLTFVFVQSIFLRQKAASSSTVNWGFNMLFCFCGLVKVGHF